jgi:hypothetical protein
VLTLALVATFIASIPAAAFTSSWTKPKLVFKHDSAPTHSMVTDGAGKVHIATERGAGGVWYVSNASGSWQQCQISDRNDRQPSIALSGSVVHIAFARQTDGQKGVYTASSDQPALDPGCGWAVTKRYSGSSSSPSLAAFGATLSIAFNTGARKLRFLKGAAASNPWTPTQVVDGKCCTSAPVLALTTTGSPRIAYGDGTSKSDGLKFAKRTSKGWKKSKVHGGRIKHIAMVLDRTPGIFGEPPSNFPRIAYVVKKQGAYLATQGGGWGKRFLGKAFGQTAVTHASNLTQIIVTKNGRLNHHRSSGGIWFATKLSGAATDTKPRFDGGQLTFSRKSGTKGIFYTRPK